MSYFYYGSPHHYKYQGYGGLPNYYGYSGLPNYSYNQNYTVPFYTYPGWFHRPHYYYPRNRYTQTNNAVCHTAESKSGDKLPGFCPIKAHAELSKNQTMCVFPDGTKQTAAESMAHCQDPGIWGLNQIR